MAEKLETNVDGENIALDYYDCLVRYKDVNLLRGNHWLNDAIIGFYFEYLQHSDDTIRHTYAQVLFVSPELTQLLKLSVAIDYPAFLDPLNAKEYNYVLFPLNNCESREAAGGSHWSLLVYSRKEHTTFHLDSCGETNRLAAGQFAKKIMSYLDETGAKNVKEMVCPQQVNGYDCGLFVLCFADAIVKHICKTVPIQTCDFQDVPHNVKGKRKGLLDLIQKIKKKPSTDTGVSPKNLSEDGNLQDDKKIHQLLDSDDFMEIINSST